MTAPADSQPAWQRLPRPVALVLGGGAAYGAVQVGMLQALATAGVVPDLVVGTSVGALNGAVLAADPVAAPHQLAAVWASMRREQVFPSSVVGWYRTLRRTQSFLFDAEPLTQLVREQLAVETFADLTLPFGAVAVDLDAGVPVLLRDGDLVSAVVASAAIPGVFPAVERQGRRLVDGGVLANVPVRQAVELGAASLVVLDCGLLTVRPDRAGSVVGVLVQTIEVMARATVARDVAVVAPGHPLVYLPGAQLHALPSSFRDVRLTIEASYRLASAFLAEVADQAATGAPGLYGGPELVRRDPAVAPFVRH